MSPSNRVGQLYPQALGYVFVTCDSQGYGGGILTCLHMRPLCFSSYIYIKQKNEDSVDPHHDLTCTSDILSTELEKAVNASFSEVGVLPIKRR
jgi:hypothetical protein